MGRVLQTLEATNLFSYIRYIAEAGTIPLNTLI